MTATMSPRMRKFVLTVHITVSVGVIGAIAAFLALAIAGLAAHDAQTMQVAYPAMDLIARFVIVPLAAAALLSGLIQSLGTSWGLLRHNWILAKLVLTAFAVIVLLAKLPLVSDAARLSQRAILPSAELSAAGLQLLVHAIGGLLVLLVPTVLSIYKPQGMTAYGRRMSTEPRSSTRHFDISTNGVTMASAPHGAVTVILRRAYVVGFIFVVIAAHVLVLHVMGGQLHLH